MNEDQLNALINWVDAKIKSIIDSDCIGASLCERELREELKNIMMSETTYIGETKWMQVPEPLDNVEIMTIAAEHTWDLKRFARAIEKAHGITGGEE